MHMLEFKKVTDFPRGTLYNIVCDAYSYDDRNKRIWDGNWKENGEIEIRDIQTSDISSDLLDVSSVPVPYQEAAYRNMQMVLQCAKEDPNYHWLCAYQNGVRTGSVYALYHQGFVEMDDLWVEPEYRNRYIATTLMKYIVKTFGGTLYLHADASATPKDMYARMGFETVETVYDYYLEWD